MSEQLYSQKLWSGVDYSCKVTVPEPAGMWHICNNEFHFSSYKKPNLFHRWMARLLLGWRWEAKR